MHKEIAPFLLLIVMVALAYSTWVFQAQIADAQKQADTLQDQLAYYENSTSALQTRVNNLEAQVLDLQNPVYNVTIENINSTIWYYPAGMAMWKDFSITIKNIGFRDVGGLTFEFKILDNGTVWNSGNYEVGMIAPDQLGVLHVQESTIIKALIQTGVGVSFAGKSFVVTVILDKAVLAEQMLLL